MTKCVNPVYKRNPYLPWRHSYTHPHIPTTFVVSALATSSECKNQGVTSGLFTDSSAELIIRFNLSWRAKSYSLYRCACTRRVWKTYQEVKILRRLNTIYLKAIRPPVTSFLYPFTHTHELSSFCVSDILRMPISGLHLWRHLTYWFVCRLIVRFSSTYCGQQRFIDVPVGPTRLLEKLSISQNLKRLLN